jgi:murein DD-endopeptidase MepM/ murein hydrolase activator NlpD
MRLSPSTDTLRRQHGRRRGRLLLVLLLLAAATVAGLGAFRVGPAPRVEIRPALPAIGRSTPVEITVAEPARGLSEVRVDLIQKDAAIELAADRLAPLAPWKLWGARTPEKTYRISVGKDHQETLAEGEATIRVTATPAPAWLRRGEPVTVETTLAVRLVPPAVEIVSSQHYVAQGGCEAVVYRVGASAVRDGVRVGELFFPGFQVPGGLAGDRFALFAIPFDTGDASDVHVVAEDEVGNRRSAAFVDQFFPQPPRSDDIVLSDAFLERVVPAILENTPDLVAEGSLLDRYLVINRELRRRNAEELTALAARSKPEFLWKAPFLTLPGGQVMSSFADRRTYFYDGREVDRQVHLGFDLASVARADVPASNSGVVVLARYLGIYGNTVVVDHGFGLMSLSAHLSSIAVAEGDEVQRGQVLGRSGATGLAGGDHLHFSFLLQGVPVRPVEWWDPHWIGDRLKRKLGPALPFGG